MEWLFSIDVAVFRWINASLSNRLFDVLMPFLSHAPFFWPTVLLMLLIVIFRGGPRSRVWVTFIVLGVILGDGVLCSLIKNAVHRPRPFQTLDDVLLLVGRGNFGSMPSGHTFNWFSATFITYVFYRRSIWLMLPLAFGVGFSRIYNGVHYPSDVVAGALLGAGFSAFLVWSTNTVWQVAGPRWFSAWHRSLPNLLEPVWKDFAAPTLEPTPGIRAQTELQWLRFGYVLVWGLCLARLVYLAAGKIELSEDEAYQWIWSKHLALSYYSKPPLIAYTQFLGTSIFGDNAFGVRFFSPILTAVVCTALLRFFWRELSGRIGFAVVLAATATPLFGVGSILMTVDPLSVSFWTFGVLAGWRAVGVKGTTRDWCWLGFWMGLGFLSKYTNLFQWLCLALLFLFFKQARHHLARPGPYLALGINLLFTIPVLVWNASRDWITVAHVAHDGRLGQANHEPWHRYLNEFAAAEFALLNPVFFIGGLIAFFGFWRKKDFDFRKAYFFFMGAPVFLFYLAFTFHARVFPNWIAPSVLPLICLMVLYWSDRWNKRWVRRLFFIGIGLGVSAITLLHDTNLLGKLTGRHLPPQKDPLRRVRGWKTTAELVEEQRERLEAEGQKPSFIIADHYGMVGQLSFYNSKAREQIQNEPLVYYLWTAKPDNQFYFWDTYTNRVGQNAIYVQQMDDPELVSGWVKKWWRGETNFTSSANVVLRPPPELITKQFGTVKDLGMFEVHYRENRIFRRVQLFECRNLLPP